MVVGASASRDMVGPGAELLCVRRRVRRCAVPGSGFVGRRGTVGHHGKHPKGLAGDRLTVEFPQAASFHRQLAEEPKNATLLAEALYEVTGRHLELAFEVGENGGESEPELEEPVSEEEIIELMRGTLDAREVEPE